MTLTTVDAAALTALLKDTVSVATAEACLKQAVRSINLVGLSHDIHVNELSGSPLAGDYSGEEAAGILQVAIAVYSVNYKTSGASSSSSNSFGVGPISSSESSSSSISSGGNSSTAVSAAAYEVVMLLYKADGINWSRAII